MARAPGTRLPTEFSPGVGKTLEEHVQFHVRDIVNRRGAGIFESETEALASLKGVGDGRFSVNNHRGAWCEVLVCKGELLVRRSLMDDGNPAAFLSIEL